MWSQGDTFNVVQQHAVFAGSATAEYHEFGFRNKTTNRCQHLFHGLAQACFSPTVARGGCPSLRGVRRLGIPAGAVRSLFANEAPLFVVHSPALIQPRQSVVAGWPSFLIKLPIVVAPPFPRFVREGWQHRPQFRKFKTCGSVVPTLANNARIGHPLSW